jgi:hypothetical protein
VVAIEGGRWEIYVGGAAGAHVRKGDLLATVDSHEAVVSVTGRFLQYYRENANWLERTYAFVPRVGIEHLRSVRRRGQRGHLRRPRRARPGVDRRLHRSLAGARRAGDGRTVPHLPALDRGRLMSGTASVGALDEIPLGEGAPSRSAATCRRLPAPRRLRARGLGRLPARGGRSPTGRSTARSSSARCTCTPSTSTTGCSRSGQPTCDRLPVRSTRAGSSSPPPRLGAPWLLRSPRPPASPSRALDRRLAAGGPGVLGSTRRPDRPAQPRLLDLLRAHRLLGVDDVVGAGAVPRPAYGFDPARSSC